MCQHEFKYIINQVNVSNGYGNRTLLKSLIYFNWNKNVLSSSIVKLQKGVGI